MVASGYLESRPNADGTVERHKVRLVAQGFSQKFRDEYDETFSPVVRFESVRTIVALAAQHGLILHQMDVTTEFLNGELKDQKVKKLCICYAFLKPRNIPRVYITVYKQYIYIFMSNSMALRLISD